jgi:hypothetical protein
LFSNYQAVTLSYRTRTKYEEDNDDDDDNNNNNNNTYLMGEITLHIAQIVNTEQMQH